jgi:UDP-glucose 4-epimerase
VTHQTTCLLTGAAGFIGSHVADRLLGLGYRVIGIDNFRLGRWSNLRAALAHADFQFIAGDVNDYDANVRRLRELCVAEPIDVVWHLAANSDIRAGAVDPHVDLEHTFLTTFNVLKLMRELGIRRLAFSSSSAIYGLRDGPLGEETGPCFPISNYGAMKLASEGLISAALEAWLDRAWIFRFPNVVGSRGTHGVVVDFLEKLQATRAELLVLGDGKQEKPYLHVSELVEAMVFIVRQTAERLNCFNIGPDGSATTVASIAATVVRHWAPGAVIRYSGGAQGWPGDVPRFQYSIERLRRLGWVPRLSSDAAVELAVQELVKERIQAQGTEQAGAVSQELGLADPNHARGLER